MRQSTRKLKMTLREVGAKYRGKFEKVSVRIERISRGKGLYEHGSAVSHVDALTERQEQYIKAAAPGAKIYTNRELNFSIVTY